MKECEKCKIKEIEIQRLKISKESLENLLHGAYINALNEIRTLQKELIIEKGKHNEK